MKPKNTLQKWEVAIVKAMIASKRFTNQEMLSYFSRPGRSLNQARIVDIKQERIHKVVKAASDAELEGFLSSWPDLDPKTGLHIRSDELIIKSREAMLLAVQAYNSPTCYFRSEVFIATAIIAWTYLMHAFYKSQTIDYRHHEMKDGRRTLSKTKHGADKYWELEKCLEHAASPIDKHTKKNLLFLITIRHEIEHQMTSRIDDALSAKLQACALNFNRYVKKLFGDRTKLDGDLTSAIQFSAFTLDQQKALFREKDLPANILAAQKSFEEGLSAEDYSDEKYAFRVALVQKTVSNKGTADEVIEFIKPGSEEGEAINRVLLKEVEKQKFRPGMVVEIVRAAGYPKFNMRHHTQLCNKLKARDPKQNWGTKLTDNTWYWYESWIEKVKEHCAEEGAVYR
jgi:uncharacterized protein DUF3644